MMAGRTVEVRFGFRSPVAKPSYPIHFDAVLLYANAVTPEQEPSVRELLDRAVASHGEGERRIYCCSALSFIEAETFTRFNTRRFEVDVMARDIDAGLLRAKPGSKVDTQRGDVKGLLADIPMMWASQARAYARVTDLEAFKQLLASVRQIGKFGRLGSGRVRSIEFDPESQAPDDAWMRRVLPFAVDGAAPLRATVSPPYWDRRRIQDAYLHPALLD